MGAGLRVGLGNRFMAIFLFNVVGSSVYETQDPTAKESADEETKLRRKTTATTILNTRGE